MTTRLAAVRSAPALTILAALFALFAAGPAPAATTPASPPASPPASATGPNVAVSQAGNYPTQPNSYGNFSVRWTSAGTADTTGITHLTVDLPPGLTTGGALMYSTPYDYTFDQTVSPDGRHLEATFRGTRVPGRGDFMKVQVSSGAERPSGVIRATVANRDDVDATDNVSTYTVNGPQRPADVPRRPVVTGIGTTTGPGAGGTAVTVTGTGLDDGFVLFGADQATMSHCTATQCTATTPGGSGSVPVTVVTPGGAADAPGGFAYTGPPPAPPAAPVVTGLNRTSGPSQGGTSVYVLGKNLAGGTIAFGDAPAAHVSCGKSFCSGTSPAGSGTVHVTVTTAGGTSATVDADRFTYTGTEVTSAPGARRR
ncbi:IPT/TIG domain-containing protein [Streptomyces chrestomyceticus]|uniref:IPT/TIG domain-containing protein n=1 Tax=Streptomyces chrestomyceticus TaxID=68185 RepID=UPI0036BE89A9